MRKRNRTTVPIALIVLLGIAAGVALAARSATDEPERVPDVVGLTLIEATTTLTEAGFAWKLSSRDETHTEPIQPRTDGGTVSPSADHVTAQDPAGGAGVESGTTIKLKTRCSEVACQ